MTAILGISAFYHDAAAALVVDGEIVAAAQEERFSRRKHDEDFPARAIAWCLDEAGLPPEELDYVGFYDKPMLKFERLLESHLAVAPRGFAAFAKAMPVWLKRKLWLPREMRRGLPGYRGAFVFTEHHESHAAAAFFPSPFEEAAILTLDGVGEWATASQGTGSGNRIRLSHELRFPHSLGLLYTAFTGYCGFQVNADEYKLMGLAPYGRPVYADLILEKLLDLKEDGSFRMDLSYFDYVAGLRMTSEKFHRLFAGAPRLPESPIEERHMDLAASIQRVTEEVVLRAARHLHARTGARNLCLGGGVALNCVANGRLLREGPFERIWIQPAAGDAGSALGVALFIWHQLLGSPRRPSPSDAQHGSLLGPAFSECTIQDFLDGAGARYRRFEGAEACAQHVAGLLADGKVVGWFQGRMEFGPRALGSRSILADPRQPDMQRVLNQKVKFREGFRPFAPAVLREDAPEWFEWRGGDESPYMLVVCPVAEAKRTPLGDAEARLGGLDLLRARRSSIPAVTHVDLSARLQTVDAGHQPHLRPLLEAFRAHTGCPVLVNTSFNLGWEPIVRSPREAFETFMSCDMDALCLGPFVLEKSAQRGFVAAGAQRRPERLIDDLLASPCCGAALETPAQRGGGAGSLVCAGCGHAFPVEEGIPRLYWPHEGVASDADVTERVKDFYEEHPFPDYEEHDSVRSLIEKSRRSGYARELERAIPLGGTVLEVGCGTGQLSNFLGISCRRVVGTDLCLDSLRLGEGFRAAHGLDRTVFLQMNLFRPALRPGSFDVLLCNGVLHHTSDPFGGLAGLVPLVRPGGHVVIGLYNRFGRAMTDLRRQLFRLTGGRGRWIDPHLRSGLGAARQRAWFADQYRHPHESEHTIGEVQGWFERCGLDFVRGVPPVILGDEPSPEEGLFHPARPGTPLDHLLAQISWVATGNREGGFFVLIGRRRGAAGKGAPAAGRRIE